MRLVLSVALALALAGGASLAQSPPLRRGPPAEGTPQAATPSRLDAQVDAARLRSEARLREREEKARRTLKGICSGC